MSVRSKLSSKNYECALHWTLSEQKQMIVQMIRTNDIVLRSSITTPLETFGTEHLKFTDLQITYRVYRR